MPGVCWPSEASCCSQAHVHVCQDGRHQARPDKSRKNADASEDNHHANDDDEGAKPASIIAEQDYLSAIGANKLRYSNRSAEVSRARWVQVVLRMLPMGCAASPLRIRA